MRCLSILLSLLISLPFSPSAAAQGAVGKINLIVVEGEGAINNIRQRTAREPIVQVEDENHKPIAGAAVVFTLPSQGAGGTFAGGQKTLTVMTDSRGQAVGRGFRTNNLQGRFEIRVNASYQGQAASATIAQTTVATAAGAAAAAGISAKLIAILAVVGAAAVAGGVVAATRGGSNTPAAGQTTSVTAGTSTVGPPR
jgi:hypothetical protein